MPVAIRTGVTDGTMTEVIDGNLSEGDSVITDVSGGNGKGQQPGFGRMF